MMEIKIRKAKVGDEKGIAKMFLEGIKLRNFSRTSTNKPFSKERIKKMREAIKSSKSDFYFIALDNKKIVGSISFHFKKEGRKRHMGDMGWAVHPNYQGKGIAILLMRNILEYVKKNGFKKVEAEIAVDNKPSLKLVKNFKFKIEGRKKKALLLDNGKFIDLYIVGKIF